MKTRFWFLSRIALCIASSSACFAQENADPSRLLNLPTAEGQPGSGPLRQADWFRDLWNSRRTAWAKSAQSDQGSLVLLGDSITQGWPTLDGYFPGVKIANRGISGDTTRGMLIRLEKDVLAIKPRGVVMLMGTNDLEEQAEPETIASNVSLILKALKAYDSNMPIILCLVFPSSESKSRPTSKIQATNKLLLQLVKGDSQITVLDTFSLYANESGDAKLAEFPDLLHLNKAGYDKWAASLRPLLATLDFLETEEDHFELEPGFVSLFNGKDLSGWEFKPKGGGEPERFEAKTKSPDGRYVAKHGRLIVTTPAEWSRIQQLWTTREFPMDFTLRLEFRATPNADSGVFIRKPQLQCRDYLLAGPYKELKKYRQQDWNSLEVKVEGGVAHCTCNGEVLEGKLAVPSTGPIGLEGDRGQMEYRRIRVLESK
jgi:lysophospholipase L1-like esterase